MILIFSNGKSHMHKNLSDLYREEVIVSIIFILKIQLILFKNTKLELGKFIIEDFIQVLLLVNMNENFIKFVLIKEIYVWSLNLEISWNVRHFKITWWVKLINERYPELSNSCLLIWKSVDYKRVLSQAIIGFFKVPQHNKFKQLYLSHFH